VEILLLFVMIFFCIVGMIISQGLKAASREAIRVGDALVEESKRVQAEFDLALEQAQQTLQKPQTNDVAERLVYRMEVKGR
jgi:cell division protein FtsL